MGSVAWLSNYHCHHSRQVNTGLFDSLMSYSKIKMDSRFHGNDDVDRLWQLSGISSESFLILQALNNCAP